MYLKNEIALEIRHIFLTTTLGTPGTLIIYNAVKIQIYLARNKSNKIYNYIIHYPIQVANNQNQKSDIRKVLPITTKYEDQAHSSYKKNDNISIHIGPTQKYTFHGKIIVVQNKCILSMVRLSQSRTNVNTAYFTVTYILIFLNQKPTNAFERNFRIQRPVLKIVALIARKTNQRKNKKECKYQKMPYKACPSQMLNFYFLGIINTNQFIKKSRTSTPHIYSNSNCRT
eukprot:TRINITY_DN18893_c0_g1_i17.p1 TRINITY_DN18893_c0_g1~~TRINITY_DN18893_c0_g1_i17.p1  ORF type:complete len:228 (+),score=-14.58 TRINITY_DN18893_c0_g1_i17:108-791(+)